MDNFFAKVYQVVRQVPRGKVATYGQIAAMIGNPLAARMVGEAMRKTPEYLDIPCHRVVNRAGEMSPAYAFGGAGRQRQVLEQEGVVFKGNGCIDMEKCLWKMDLKQIL
jgi:methylated-DNA-protein-cysteine methyltransferase related protein